MPAPVRHPAEYLFPKRGEGTWVEVEGIVRSLGPGGILELKAGGEILRAALPAGQAGAFQAQVDCSVRARGVITYPSERERLLLVPSPVFLEVREAAPRDPFAGELRSTSQLTSENLLNQSHHRMRLQGTVTHATASVLYVQDEYGVARIETETPAAASVGASVELAGFPDLGEDGGLVLRHTLVRVRGQGVAPEPRKSSLAELATMQAAGRLVRVRALVHHSPGEGDSAPLELEAERRVFRVSLPGQEALGRGIPEGSLIELTGVLLRDPGLLQGGVAGSTGEAVSPAKLSLLLRGPEDLRVLQKPSWWVLRRALLAVGLCLAVLLVVGIWIQRLRRRVRQRTRELEETMGKLKREAHMAATLAERDRLAGEIHDSLEQGLNGLVFQLESMAGESGCPEDIRRGLRLACNMASFSRTEVQYAVWELQSPMLEDSELPAAIEKIMRQIVPETVQGSVQVEGSPRRLPSVVEHHLLRIAQEAMNNTVKHAKAKVLDVRVSYETGQVVLSIRDDGCGFVPEKVSTGGLGHFGLRSLRSRAAKIQASLDVRSVPGAGTILSVRVPDPESNPSTHVQR